jgi:hypothetical protein
MAIALERHLAAATARPGATGSTPEKSRLDIAVVFTSLDSTLAALTHAGALANRTGRRLTLLVPQVVPYPLPLTSPPVLIDWNDRRFRVIAETSPVDTIVRLYLCRDREETLMQVLARPSLVVIGGARRWWRFTAERRLARHLRQAGHEVVFIETE